MTPKRLFPRIQNGKEAGQDSEENKTELERTVESARINFFRDARKPQKIVDRLARKADELHVEKVRRLRKLIAKGEYEVDPREVAKSIIRAERRPKESKVQSMNIDLESLLAVTEAIITVWQKMTANIEDQEKLAAAWDVVALSKPIDAEPSLAFSAFSARRI